MITLPYGRQTVTEADIEAVSMVLRSDWLTNGPKVPEFERPLAEFVRHAVVVNSETAGLHRAMAAFSTSTGDEVIVPSISFVATSFEAIQTNVIGAKNVIYAAIIASSGLPNRPRLAFAACCARKSSTVF